VTEQIDALRTLATHPVDYLVVPRLAALIIALPLLTAESIALDAGVRPGEAGRQLARLRDAGLVTERADGWVLAPPRFDPVPGPCLGREPRDG